MESVLKLCKTSLRVSLTHFGLLHLPGKFHLNVSHKRMVYTIISKYLLTDDAAFCNFSHIYSMIYCDKFVLYRLVAIVVHVISIRLQTNAERSWIICSSFQRKTHWNGATWKCQLKMVAWKNSVCLFKERSKTEARKHFAWSFCIKIAGIYGCNILLANTKREKEKQFMKVENYKAK